MTTTEETLAREARWRVRAGVSAIAAAALTIAGGIVSSLIYADFPRVQLLDALRDAAGLPIAGREGLRTDQVLFYDRHSTDLLIVAVILTFGALALIPALLYLYEAAKARRPAAPPVARVLAVAGPVTIAVSELVLQIAASVKAHNFATGNKFDTATAHDALNSGAIVAAQVLRQGAAFAIGFAFVLIALNAMRVGLLTRFMGVLGIIVGVLFVVPLGSRLPIVQTFWLVALGAMLLGYWPNGVPPAWSSGEAVPWPTQQQLREQRDAGQRPQALQRKSLPDEPPAKEHSASKKKKRRRRN